MYTKYTEEKKKCNVFCVNKIIFYTIAEENHKKVGQCKCVNTVCMCVFYVWSKYKFIVLVNRYM